MIVVGTVVFRYLLLGFTLLLVCDTTIAQDELERTRTPQTPPPAQLPSQSPQASGGTIHGIVKSANMPIPGAAVSISASSDSSSPADRKISVWTDVDGTYSAALPAEGSYTVRVEMMAFANSTQRIVIDATHQSVVANFDLTLLSRTHESVPQARRPNAVAGAQRGFQALSALQNAATQDAGGNAMSDVVPSGMPVPGIDPNSATESVSVSGNSNALNSMSGDELQQRINDARQNGGGFGGAGGGFGQGGFGGGGGGRAMNITGRRGFDINHPHGSIYYGIGDSALNATPYALQGEPASNPGYVQNSYRLITYITSIFMGNLALEQLKQIYPQAESSDSDYLARILFQELPNKNNQHLQLALDALSHCNHTVIAKTFATRNFTDKEYRGMDAVVCPGNTILPVLSKTVAAAVVPLLKALERCQQQVIGVILGAQNICRLTPLHLAAHHGDSMEPLLATLDKCEPQTRLNILNLNGFWGITEKSAKGLFILSNTMMGVQDNDLVLLGVLGNVISFAENHNPKALEPLFNFLARYYAKHNPNHTIQPFAMIIANESQQKLFLTALLKENTLALMQFANRSLHILNNQSLFWKPALPQALEVFLIENKNDKQNPLLMQTQAEQLQILLQLIAQMAPLKLPNFFNQLLQATAGTDLVTKVFQLLNKISSTAFFQSLNALCTTHQEYAKCFIEVALPSQAQDFQLEKKHVTFFT